LEKVMGIISRRLVTLDDLARTKEIIIKKYEPADLAFRNLGIWKKGLMFRNGGGPCTYWSYVAWGAAGRDVRGSTGMKDL
jgi:hypothetical protein